MNITKIQKEKPIEELINFSIINVNKPSGLTSFKVADKIRKILRVKKTGHFGTLDPKVTGVLPVALGNTCRLSGFFMGHDKEYIGIMHLHEEIDKEKLNDEMKNFIGKINQMPPVRSSVKRALRERNISEFKIISKIGKDVEFHAEVQAGTYIRKLVYDLGEKIGGAHMTSLKRIRAGIFIDKDMRSIEEIEEAFSLWESKADETKLREILVPAEIVSEFFPIVNVRQEFKQKFKNGSPLFRDMLQDENDFEKLKRLKDEERVCLFSDEEFIEIAKISNKDNRIAMPDIVIS